MKIRIKVNKYSIQGDEMHLHVNMEDFKAMLNRVNPRMLWDYIYERMIMNEAKKGGKVC